MSRSGVPMQGLRDRARIMPSVVQDDGSRAMRKIDDTLLGIEPFTGLNVGGQDVKPFLDKTDGSEITTATALGSSTVLTDTVGVDEITDYVAVSPSGAITLAPSVWTEVLTGNIVTTGGRVGVFARADVDVTAPLAEEFSTGIRLLRGGVVIASKAGGLSVERGGIKQEFSEAVSVEFTDTPSAGTITYSVEVIHNAPTPTVQLASNRYMQLEEVKR